MDLEELKKQLEIAQKELEEAEAAFEPIKNKENELSKQRNALQIEYNRKMQEIRNEYMALEEKSFEGQTNLNSKRRQLRELQRDFKAAKRAEEKAKAERDRQAQETNRWRAMTKTFEEGTKNAPWRDEVKEHQIIAAHKINLNQKLILADSMGLGKTLSVIATADMAIKATELASPDFPYLGEEVEVYKRDSYKWTGLGVQAKETDLFPDSYDHIEPVAGATLVNHLDYDTKQRFVNRGWLEFVPAHYETVVQGAIQRPVGRKILYFCPAPLLRNVMEEWQKWSPQRNVAYIGGFTKDQQNFFFDNALAHLSEYVVITNYESWRRNRALLDRLIACDFDTVIIDEAHNIKDMKSIAYKGVEKVIKESDPEFVIPMTGTPILNRPQELFSLLHLVNPKEFNHLNDYLFRYCEEYVPEGSNTPRWKFKDGGLDRLIKQISNNFLRRTKEDAGIILPKKTVIHHDLELDETLYPDQARAREHMKKYAAVAVGDNSITVTAIIALFTRLRQIETWPAGIKIYKSYTDTAGKKIFQRDPKTNEKIIDVQLDVEESQKIDYIIRYDEEGGEWEGLIPDNVEDERMVVFSQFKEPLRVLKNRIERAGYRAVVLDGDTSKADRNIIRRDFDRNHTPDRDSAKYDVVLCNYKAGGVGLNLTAATNMVILDEEWSPGKRDQAFDRVHRIGQSEAVTINVVRTKDTIDTWLAGIISEKENLVNGFEQAAVDIDKFRDFLDGN